MGGRHGEAAAAGREFPASLVPSPPPLGRRQVILVAAPASARGLPRGPSQASSPQQRRGTQGGKGHPPPFVDRPPPTVAVVAVGRGTGKKVSRAQEGRDGLARLGTRAVSHPTFRFDHGHRRGCGGPKRHPRPRHHPHTCSSGMAATLPRGLLHPSLAPPLTVAWRFA